MFRKHMAQYGMMAYGLIYGNLGLGVGCGKLIRIIVQSAVLQVGIGQGATQGCSMSPIFHFINQLLDEVEKAGIGS